MNFSAISILIILSSASAMAESPQYSPQNQLIIINQASQAQAPEKYDHTIGVCHLFNSTGVDSGSDPLSPIYVISPAETVRDYLGVIEKKFFSYENEIKVTLIQGPEHGILKAKASGDYRYTPEADYIGIDHVTLLVEIGGLKVKAVYNFKVIDGGAIGGTEGQDKKNCPKGMYWKISLKPKNTEAVIWS
jgi:hypothetical protein